MFKTDYDEIKDILLAVYGEAYIEELSAADNAIERITVPTDEEYLNESAAFIREKAKNDSELLMLLSTLYTHCCCEGGCDGCAISK